MGRGNPNWKKGISANPGGRPKKQVEFIDSLELEDVPTARLKLREALVEKQGWAIQLVLQYVYGRPSEMALDLTTVPREQLAAEILRRDLEEGRPSGEVEAESAEAH